MDDDAAPVPEIFAEGYRGVFSRAGFVKLNLVANRLPVGAEAPVLQHVATLTIPWPDLLEVVGALNSLVDELKRKMDDVTVEGERE